MVHILNRPELIVRTEIVVKCHYCGGHKKKIKTAVGRQLPKEIVENEIFDGARQRYICNRCQIDALDKILDYKA